MSKKTYVLIVSSKFAKDHPRSGEPTEFPEKIIMGEKIHTIRANYKYWKPKLEAVNRGEAILSIRTWEDKPYRSKQRKILELDKVGFQKCEVWTDPEMVMNKDAGHLMNVEKNDGLSCSDFWNWFKHPLESAIIIHFSDFRY